MVSAFVSHNQISKGTGKYLSTTAMLFAVHQLFTSQIYFIHSFHGMYRYIKYENKFGPHSKSRLHSAHQTCTVAFILQDTS